MKRDFNQDDFLFSGSAPFVLAMYNSFAQNPSSVDPSWESLFKQLQSHQMDDAEIREAPSWALNNNHHPRQESSGHEAYSGVNDGINSGAAKKSNGMYGGSNALLKANEVKTNEVKPTEGQTPQAETTQALLRDYLNLSQLILSYRAHGHLLARLDPLELNSGAATHPLLNPHHYQFLNYQQNFDLRYWPEIAKYLGQNNASLAAIIGALQAIYCGTLAYEFNHLSKEEEINWLIAQAEQHYSFQSVQQQQFLRILTETDAFEKFLHVKFQGAKRFSIEGGDSMMVALQIMLEHAAAHTEVDEFIVGMAHRGRLNVLTNFIDQPYLLIFAQFAGKFPYEESTPGAGDVKYHMGGSCDRVVEGKKIHLSLMANPSHLESVNPVLMGKVKAKQDFKNDASKVLGVLIHGDAAFAGQGVVAESLQLSQAPGYDCKGIIHIVINNQVGFTANPSEAHYEPYCTGWAKSIAAPILHVNGDDVEAVARAARIAAEYRHLFSKDIIVDIVCYRRHGHNESDEPNFTQPQMYAKIDQHPTPNAIYSKQLIDKKVISQESYNQYKVDYEQKLIAEYNKLSAYKAPPAPWLKGAWLGVSIEPPAEPVLTGVSSARLRQIGNQLSEVPQGFNANSKIVRQLNARKKALEEGHGFDWGLGEALAFASLLCEKVPIRLSGQDCQRGTFSHRHAVLHDQTQDLTYTPFNNLMPNQANITALNSPLSEFGVMGFEYGYSLVNPHGLVLWEGQFGDFANGAQTIIDQYLSAAESKWYQLSGLVLLLPHAFEGMGPEHSSARLERFLQLCAENNMQVMNCSTPANYFHALRRQIHQSWRKPLIIMTPKSLLRHKLAVSSINEMDEGTHFQPVITLDGLEDAHEHEKMAPKIGTNGHKNGAKVSAKPAHKSIHKLVLCSGKVYYDLWEAREAKGIKNVKLVRLEQFYPWPQKELEALLEQYKDAEIIWCQEEPMNMGAWSFVAPRFNQILQKMAHSQRDISYAGRPAAASPATGQAERHNREQRALIELALQNK